MFKLDKYLYKNRMTAKDFAASAGISQPTLRKLGKSPVSLKIAKKVATLTGCPLMQLLNPKQVNLPASGK